MKTKIQRILLILAFILPSFTFAKEYAAKWSYQDQGSWNPGAGLNAHVIFPGKQTLLQARFQNVGEKCWSNDPKDEGFVGFYVYKDTSYSTPLEYNNLKSPLFGSSLWAGPGWGTSYDGKTQNARAASLKEAKVCPGQVGTFQFTINGPTSTEFSNSYQDDLDTKIPENWHREDLSLAVRDQWMEADAAYPKGTGDPLGIAHVWFPIRFEDNVLKQEEVDFYQDLGKNILNQMLPELDAMAAYEIKHYDDKDEIRQKKLLVQKFVSKLVDVRGEFIKLEPPYELQKFKELNVDMIDIIKKAYDSEISLLNKLENGTITEAEFKTQIDNVENTLDDTIDDKNLEISDDINDLKDNWPTLDLSSLNS